VRDLVDCTKAIAIAVEKWCRWQRLRIAVPDHIIIERKGYSSMKGLLLIQERPFLTGRSGKRRHFSRQDSRL
jgi:hypothetical protein